MVQKLLANNCAKFSKFLVEKLNLGKGSALPGRVALTLDPKYLRKYNAELQEGDYGFFISGTNGKTTSSGLLASIIESASGSAPVNNAFGANLYYGIASELVNSSSCLGALNSQNFVFEVDEAALRQVAKDLSPKTVLLTNIFRDQLDRFGEIDATQKLLVEGLEVIESKSPINLVLNANDKKIAQIKEQIDLRKFTPFMYGVENIEIAFKESSVEVDYSDIFSAKLLERKAGGSLIELNYKDQSIEIYLPIAGDFNIYNACAAAAAAYISGISFANIKKGIESYKGAFGRGEKKLVNGKEVNVFLIKNPAGATEVINFISQFPKSKVLIAINDNYADGRDVSWLWDAVFENLDKNISYVCSGTRAADMALRLKYAGIENITVDNDLILAIEKLAFITEKDENLFVLPTYTALLEINSKL